MVIVRCPECRKKDFYFDSPSRNELYLYLKDGQFFIYDVLNMKKVRRNLELVTMFESEISCEEWEWTCEHCAEGIDYGRKEWKQLKKKALEFLSTW